jgi:hypothetical protein
VTTLVLEMMQVVLTLAWMSGQKKIKKSELETDRSRLPTRRSSRTQVGILSRVLVVSLFMWLTGGLLLSSTWSSRCRLY